MAKAKPKSPDDLLSTPEAGAELGIGVARVNVLIQEGRLPATKIGKVWIIRRADLDLVRDRKPGPRPKNPGGKKPATKKKPSSKPKA
jgi:excisionase family DNA binding protein